MHVLLFKFNPPYAVQNSSTLTCVEKQPMRTLKANTGEIETLLEVDRTEPIPRIGIFIKLYANP